MEVTAAALGGPMSPAEAVNEILRRVREGGDEALRELVRSLDSVEPESFEVPKSAIAEAYGGVADELVRALEVAAKRCTRFHQAGKPEGWIDFSEGYGEMLVPVSRVGAYVPRGLASTMLMTAIPARVAGVDEVIVCTPPGADGLPDPAMLVAADLAGVNRVFGIGGAQAIAAMAYGTESVPKVDLVCGPGNVFVTLAKRALFGEVGIEGLYGPTETTVIADDTANPTLCAADLLAQAEHDVLATPVLITTSSELAEAVRREISARADGLERGEIAKASIEGRGAIAIVEDIDEALDLANALAPEASLSHGAAAVAPRGPRPERGGALHRRVLSRGAGRLRCRAQPRYAHGGHGQVQFRHQRKVVHEGHAGGRTGRRDGDVDLPARRCDRAGRGTHRPRRGRRDKTRAGPEIAETRGSK